MKIKYTTIKLSKQKKKLSDQNTKHINRLTNSSIDKFSTLLKSNKLNITDGKFCLIIKSFWLKEIRVIINESALTLINRIK